MALVPGARLGPYEILSPIGAGGMGEVYRARDSKLNRDVAIKVLPEHFTSDPDRLARFRREAQILGSLNHTSIGHIYGFQDEGGVHALVLELVEGPTLADRIAQGAIPVEEALPIARQIADALECAHEQGIIHRDLKPANIKVRDDGIVKVLDFGLAKALEGSVEAGSHGAMNSPTLTARGTQSGVIVGTAAYMAPEQARGRAVDRRADIWAFGVVLYEMLTGRRAFEGDDISITLASILKDDLKWGALPLDLPPSVRRVLRRCLEKDPKRRLSAIGDARLELEDTTDDRAAVAAPPAIAVPKWKRTLPWALAGMGFLTALALLAVWAPWRAAAPAALLRMTVDTGAGGPLDISVGPAAVLSPDGRVLALVAVNSSGRTQLFIRHLDQLQATAVAGTDDARSQFFSPDGQWVGFFAGSKLKKISVGGGAAVMLCDAVNGRGGTWTEDGSIIFQPTTAQGAMLMRVSANGGSPTPLAALGEAETTQRWPQILPGGQAVLYSGHSSTAGWDAGNIMVQPLAGGAPKVVLPGGFHGRYIRTGHLLYMHQGTLFAVPFDLSRLQVTGSAVPVIEGVSATPSNGGAQFSVSNSGTLVYVAGRSAGVESPVFWMDQTGATSVLRADPTEWYSPRFSPDGRKLATSVLASGTGDIVIYELGTEIPRKLTLEPSNEHNPVWTPDGRRVAFSSDRVKPGTSNIYWQSSDGSGEIQRLTESPNAQQPLSFHPGGKYLAFQERTAGGNLDILILQLEGDEKSGWKPGKPVPFLATPTVEAAATFSPDGKWLAYMSSESGRQEVYVRPFPGPGGKWQISSENGVYPTWSTARRELFYMVPGGLPTLMVAPFSSDGATFKAARPRQWSPTPIMPLGVSRPYDVHPDGKRVAITKPPDTSAQQRDKAVVVVNFFDELKRVVPVK